MKKIFLLGICVLLSCTIVGCSNKSQANDNSNSKNKPKSTKKSVVLYFSATNNTKTVAEKIKNVTNSDIIEIIPKEKYTSDDLDYNNDNSRANKEQNNKDARPKIKNDIDISKYDTIYLGYPIWWGTVPKIILTLFDNVNFEGKNIVLFCTSGSTGIETSYQDLKNYQPNSNWISAKRFNSSSSEEEIKNWLKTLDIKINNNEVENMYIKVNEKTLEVELNESSSTKALIEKLKENDVVIKMSDYGNFEKVGDLGFSIPTNDENITTTPGDVILYQGDKITIYYDTNTWNFTKLGKIKNTSQKELKKILGDNDITVTISLNK